MTRSTYEREEGTNLPEARTLRLAFELPWQGEEGELDDDLWQDDEPDEVRGLSAGRGGLLLSAFLLTVAFFAPFVSVVRLDSDVPARRTVSAFELAADRAPSLWCIPAVAGCFLSIVVRRRRRSAMRGARAALLMMNLFALFAVVYSLRRIYRGAASQLWMQVSPVRVEWRWALPCFLLALVFGIYSSLRFGSGPRASALPAEEEGRRRAQ